MGSLQVSLTERLAMADAAFKDYVVAYFAQFRGGVINNSVLLHPSTIVRELGLCPIEGDVTDEYAEYMEYDYLLSNHICYMIPVCNIYALSEKDRLGLNVIYTYNLGLLRDFIDSNKFADIEKRLSTARSKCNSNECRPFKIDMADSKATTSVKALAYNNYVPFPVEWYNTFGSVLVQYLSFPKYKMHERYIEIVYDSYRDAGPSDGMPLVDGAPQKVAKTSSLFTALSGSLISAAGIDKIPDVAITYDNTVGQGKLCLYKLGVSNNAYESRRTLNLSSINAISAKCTSLFDAVNRTEVEFMKLDWTMLVPTLLGYYISKHGVSSAQEAIAKELRVNNANDKNVTDMLALLWANSGTSKESKAVLESHIDEILPATRNDARMYKHVRLKKGTDLADFSEHFNELTKAGVLQIQYTKANGQRKVYLVTNDDTLCAAYYGALWGRLLGNKDMIKEQWLKESANLQDMLKQTEANTSVDALSYLLNLVYTYNLDMPEGVLSVVDAVANRKTAVMGEGGARLSASGIEACRVLIESITAQVSDRIARTDARTPSKAVDRASYLGGNILDPEIRAKVYSRIYAQTLPALKLSASVYRTFLADELTDVSVASSTDYYNYLTRAKSGVRPQLEAYARIIGF